MNDNQLLEKLSRVFCATFDRDDIIVTPQTTGDDIEEWDSLNHLQLILAVEAGFGIRFKHVEVASFENVGDMIQAIKRHLGVL